jgi:exosortase
VAYSFQTSTEKTVSKGDAQLGLSIPPFVWYAGVLLIVFGPVLKAMMYQWQNDEDMAHGFFVPLFAAYIIWERRADIASLESTMNRWGLVLVAWGALQLWIGTLGAELFLQRTAFLITLTGIILFHGGFSAIRAVAFPLGLLIIMVPIPGIAYKQITFPLQLLASRIAETSLEGLGYMVIREGNVLELAGQTLSVVEACSGIKALLSLTFFSLVYGYLFEPEISRRWLLLIATIPVAVAANASRIVLTGVIGEYDQLLAQGAYHTVSGWILFMLAIALLVGVRHAAAWIPRRRDRTA